MGITPVLLSNGDNELVALSVEEEVEMSPEHVGPSLIPDEKLQEIRHYKRRLHGKPGSWCMWAMASTTHQPWPQLTSAVVH